MAASVLGGVLSIIGLFALLIGTSELLVRRRGYRQPDDLYGYPPAEPRVCPWPRLEPEVEALRKKGAL